MDPDWTRATRLLCVRLDALGDVLMTTPALRALKEAVPGRRLTLLTSPAGAAVAPLLPMVDDTWVYEAPWMKATGARDTRADEAMIARLRSGRFDAAVIFTVFSQNPLPSALLCWLAGIPRRAAYCRENPYQLLSDWLPEPDTPTQTRHEVQRQIDLVRTLGAVPRQEPLVLQLPPAAQREAREALRTIGVRPGDNFIVVHPGANAASRRYPEEGYARVAEGLQAAGHTVVFTGSREEEELVARVRAAMRRPGESLAGALDLAGLCALISLAPLIVTNNSGPAHIAAAVGTPVVDLYALTNPQHTPWQVPNRVLYHDVSCRHCFKSVCPAGHHACLREVAPDYVVAAALDLLAETRAARVVEA